MFFVVAKYSPPPKLPFSQKAPQADTGAAEEALARGLVHEVVEDVGAVDCVGVEIAVERVETRAGNEETANWILQRGYNDACTVCDSAEPKSVADYRACGVNAREALKGPGSVEYGLKWLQKRKIVIDPRRTPRAFREFTDYEFEKDRNGRWVSGYPDANNHTIDAVRYALERVIRSYRSNA